MAHQYVKSSDGVTIDEFVNLRRPPDQRGWPVLSSFNGESYDLFTVLNNDSDSTALQACDIYRVADDTGTPLNTATITWVKQVVNTSPGSFITEWVHDQQVHDDRIAAEAEQAAREAAKRSLSAESGNLAAAVASAQNIPQLRQAVSDLIAAVDILTDGVV